MHAKHKSSPGVNQLNADVHTHVLEISGRIGDKIYQRTTLQLANAGTPAIPNLQIKDYVRPNQPNNPAQLAARDALRRGQAAWSILTPAQKQEFNARASRTEKSDGRFGKRLFRNGHNLFISEFMRSQYPAN